MLPNLIFVITIGGGCCYYSPFHKQLKLRDIKYFAQGYIANGGRDRNEIQMGTLNLCSQSCSKMPYANIWQIYYKITVLFRFPKIQQYFKHKISMQTLKPIMFGCYPNSIFSYIQLAPVSQDAWSFTSQQPHLTLIPPSACPHITQLSA